MNAQFLTDLCLEAFTAMYRAFNEIVNFLPSSVDEVLADLHNEVPAFAEILMAVTGVVGIGDLTLLEVLFGGIMLVIVGSLAKWIRGLLP